MVAPPLSSMLSVFSNNHSELNASAPVPLVAGPVQAKHYFTNVVAALPELFAALFAAILTVGGEELPQFLRNDLCAGRRSTYGRAENYPAVLILVGPAYQRHIPYGKVEALQVLESGGSRSIRIQLPADTAFRRGPPDCLGDLCQNENG